LLTIGIALHSIIIGITLGVTSGNEFMSLLIAVAFHQFFEGFALSITALEAGFDRKSTPVLMAMLYTLTTPIGVAIGIGISSVYNGNSTTALLTQGIFDAISAGILIYDALVNLITVNITHSKWFADLSLGRKAGIFLSLWMGSGVMALIGRWA
jgi:zinc transporter 1/2/3